MEMVKSIARAVETHGGDMNDVADLIDVWERVERRNGERADIIRREARELATRIESAEAGL